MKKLKSGSVKDIYTSVEAETLFFDYTDRYSIFDWGEMPDQIPHKGLSTAMMAQFFFEFFESQQTWEHWVAPEYLTKSSVSKRLKERGLEHHALGPSDDQGNPTRGQTSIIKVKEVDIYQPELDEKTGEYKYSDYKKKPTTALVPLEVIFRFGTPEGSSLIERAKDPKVLERLGLEKAPVAGETFVRPLIEFTTKLEATDRPLSHEEAKKVAGLSETEYQKLVDLTSLLAFRLKDLFFGIGIQLWDGKFEFAFAPETDPDGQREYLMVDSIGPDELRLTHSGVQISKENLRSLYKKTNWFQDIAKAKEKALKGGGKDWKSLVKSNPEKLDPKVIELTSKLYQSLTQELFERYRSKSPFSRIPPIADVAKAWKEVL